MPEPIVGTVSITPMELTTVPPAANILFVGCTFNVNLFGVADANTGNTVNNGTCAFTISGVGFGGSMPLIPNSNGNYQGVVTASQAASLVPGTTYTVSVSFAAPAIGSGPSYQDLRVISALAQFRTQN